MNEPFKTIKRKEHLEVPSFGPSGLYSCFWSQYLGKTAPEPITDQLNQIFDAGNVVHHEDEILNIGSKRIISCETYIKILHNSELYAIGGLHDYIKIDLSGIYIEDLKSTTSGGLYYFFKDGIDEGNKIQMSIYAYLYYVEHSVWINKGVITKINKENTRERVSKEVKLYSKEYIREFLTNHPVIHCLLGDITALELWQHGYEHLKRLDDDWASGKKDLTWICVNCQYKPACELLIYIENIKNKTKK